MSTVVLSSGFLAMARHLGFVRAFQASGREPSRISGVSSGALVGALWAAGLSVAEMCEVLTKKPPIRSVRLRFPVGGAGPGLLSLQPIIDALAAHLPARIEDLPVPFSVGLVRRRDRAVILLDRGPLAEAVAASCAMPYIFGPRRIDGEAYVDGGAIDRLFLDTVLDRYAPAETIVHLVEASAAGKEKRSRLVNAQLEAALGRTALTVVRTPRSRATFWSLGPVDAQLEEASVLTLAALGDVRGSGD